MKYTLLMDPSVCIGCRICEITCSLRHTATVNLIRSRLHVTEFEGGMSIPLVCLHCEDPICMSVCPTAAIGKDEATGAVLIDPNRCIGCKMCIIACPFGGIFIDPVDRKIIKCDLCGGDPLCAKFCPTEAIEYMRTEVYSLRRVRKAIMKLLEVIK